MGKVVVSGDGLVDTRVVPISLNCIEPVERSSKDMRGP
jgi:hypothetical protein